MKSLLIKYKSVIKFILTFLLVYYALSFSYKLYLDYSDGSVFYPDYMTNLVARQSQNILQTIGYKTIVTPHPDEPSIKVIVRGRYLARIIEGCNSVSIIILFLSFIIAFSDNLKTTFLYVLVGSVLIYVFNLIRIVILTIGLYKYPWRQEILHDVVFPLMIYGMVFILWMFWVNRFSKKKKSNGTAN